MFRLERPLEEEIYWVARTNPKLLTEFMKNMNKSIAAGCWPKQKQMMAVLAALRQADQVLTEEGREKFKKAKEECNDKTNRS